MNRYSSIWDKLPDSSIWEEPYHVRILWITMLALKDRDHVVRFEAYALRKRANITEEEVEEGLRVLSNPDRKRLGQENEGRRIAKHEEGWSILNGEVYQKMMHRANLREYKARWQREKRSGLKKGGGGGPLPNEGPALVAAERGDEEGYDKLAAERVGTGGVPIPESAVPVPGVPCPVCRGAGKTRNSNFGMDLPCVACGGKGMRKEKGGV